MFWVPEVFRDFVLWNKCKSLEKQLDWDNLKFNRNMNKKPIITIRMNGNNEYRIWKLLLYFENMGIS